MSTDEHSLAQWLDAPTSDPESTLDPEVLEAVYALRPDLAPAPRVSADDILASVTAGPLAEPSATMASSLAEPDEKGQATTPAPANRSMASWGGWGGIGLALAAAATFALVGLQNLQGPSAIDQAASPAAEMEPLPAPAPEPAAQAPAKEEAKTRGAEAQDEAPPSPPAKPAARAKPRPAPAPAAVPQVPAMPDDDAYDMAAGAPVREPSLIPELTEEELEEDGVAAVAAPAPATVDSPPSDAVEAEEARRLDALRAHAMSAMGPAPSWTAGLPANELQRLEALFAEASNKAPRAAGDQVSTAIQAPAAVAHHAANLAVDYYLAAGDGTAAANAAMRGLQFRTNDAGWAGLAVRYADMIRGSDPTEAARWYEQAADAVR